MSSANRFVQSAPRLILTCALSRLRARGLRSSLHAIAVCPRQAPARLLFAARNIPPSAIATAQAWHGPAADPAVSADRRKTIRPERTLAARKPKHHVAVKPLLRDLVHRGPAALSQYWPAWPLAARSSLTKNLRFFQLSNARTADVTANQAHHKFPGVAATPPSTAAAIVEPMATVVFSLACRAAYCQLPSGCGSG